MFGFIRIATHRQVLTNPLPVADACARSQRGWRSRTSALSIPDATPKSCSTARAARYWGQSDDGCSPGGAGYRAPGKSALRGCEFPALPSRALGKSPGLSAGGTRSVPSRDRPSTRARTARGDRSSSRSPEDCNAARYTARGGPAPPGAHPEDHLNHRTRCESAFMFTVQLYSAEVNR